MLDLLLKRRSIRKFKDQEVDKESIDKIIKGALTSPSSRNLKSWQIMVVTDNDLLKKLGQTRGGASLPIKNGSLGMVIIADPEITDVWIEDATIVAIIIQLISHSLKLGSCWIQVRNRLTVNKVDVEKSVKDILNIPDKFRVECMIAIGHPDEEKAGHEVEKLAYDKVHYLKSP